MKSVRLFVVFVAGVVSIAPSALQGQTEMSVGLVGGASQYDLSGTGTTGFAALRFDVVPERARFLVFEAGLQYFRYEAQSADHERIWFPEASLQLQLPSRVVRPYVGIGAGYGFSSESEPTLSASVGSRFRIASQWSLRTELRVRAVDPWTGTTADWGLGVSRMFDD